MVCRLLTFTDADQFAAKLLEADAIEGYVAHDEDVSEYVRREIDVYKVGRHSASVELIAEMAGIMSCHVI